MTIYLKNLIRDEKNEIVQYYESKFFKQTYIVKFKHDLPAFNLIYSKNNTKEMLARQNIHILPAFHTNMILKRFTRTNQTTPIIDITDSNRFELDGTYRTNQYIFKIEFKSSRNQKSRRLVEEMDKINSLDLIEHCYNVESINESIALLDQATLASLMKSGNMSLDKQTNQPLILIGFDSIKNLFNLIYCYLLYFFFAYIFPIRK